jgi:hypothetical protein
VPTLTARHAYVLPFALLALSAISQESPTLTELDLGDKVPADATQKKNNMILSSPAQFQKLWVWKHQGDEYRLGVDDEGFVQFISTISTRVSTKEGVRVGQRWADVGSIPGARFFESSGFGGAIAMLPSGWTAHIGVKGFGESGVVIELMKWSGPGWGVRKQPPGSKPKSK